MPKTIAVLSHSAELGGAELALLDMLDSWQDLTGLLPVFIVPAQGGLTDELERRGWGYRIIDYAGWLWPLVPTGTETMFRETLRSGRAVQAIIDFLEMQQPAVTLTNTLVAPWLALAASMTGTPHIWYVHEYGDLDHGLGFDMPKTLALRDVGLMSDIVIANSNAVKDSLEPYISPEKIHTVYIPFRIEAIKDRAAEPSQPAFRHTEWLKAVVVGRIIPSKGQLEAIKAIGLLKEKKINVELVLVGANHDHKYMRKINAAIKMYGLEDRVAIIGHINNPMPIVTQADIGITPSAIEAFGRTTYEYMVLEKPVIGTASGGTPELVRDGVNGYIYEPGNVKDLSDKISRYANDQRLLHQHGSAGKRQAASLLTGEYSSPYFVPWVEDLINKHPAPVTPLLIRRFIDFVDTAEDFKNVCEHNIIGLLQVAEAERNAYKAALEETMQPGRKSAKVRNLLRSLKKLLIPTRNTNHAKK